MKKANALAIKRWARTVMQIEAEALNDIRKKLSDEFVGAIRLLFNCKGRIVVTGMGKAGIIGEKFSATLSSTGSFSFWLHAAEAVHGDLGRIKRDDVVFVLSYSGETEEIKNLIPFIKKIGAPIIALTGNSHSSLARYADATINTKVKKEACPLGLAPTTSTTAMLSVCDAIAVVLQKMRGFKEKDFAFFHPRGSLGRKLLLKVKDIMRKGKLNPVVTRDALVRDVLVKITASHAGAAIVVDARGRIKGIFTDGDLRRHVECDEHILKRAIGSVMTRNPTVVKENALAQEALKVMEDKKIDEVPVINERHQVVGMLDVQDLIVAGIV